MSDETWSRASLTVAAGDLSPAAFDEVAAELPVGPTRGTLNGGRVWFSDCPLESDSSLDDVIAWVTAEAVAVADQFGKALAGTEIAIRVSARVADQLNLAFGADLLRALGERRVSVLLDLYDA